MPTARNPLLPGFFPDPSVCRVGEDYYLVNSSFQYFPGLPLHHSRDLVHWRPAGHVLDRPEQLPLDRIRPSGGLYAPTIRHDGSRFHVVCTLVDGTLPGRQGNFVVSAEDPAGPWSDPVWLPEAPGFDPSLFFDEDGSAYLLGTRQIVGAEPAGRTEIWLRPIDPGNGWAFSGPETVLFSGALVDAVWAEGPHLYRHDDGYLLLLAEGGTADDHAITAARAERITGPYRNCPRNPLLTHRHLGSGQAVTGVGHADLVQTQHGDWYAVLLATRPLTAPDGEPHDLLGRETFLARVDWQDGWPLFSAGVGQVEPQLEVRLTGASPAGAGGPDAAPAADGRDDFPAPALAPHWNLLRTPYRPVHRLPGTGLRLPLLPETVTERACPALVARRLQHHRFEAETVVHFTPAAPGEAAGLVLLQDEDHQLRLLLGADAGLRPTLTLTERRAGQETLLASAPAPGGSPLRLTVRAEGLRLHFGYQNVVFAEADATVLSTRTAGGFTGAYIGLYATSHGVPGSANHADFPWFRYSPQP
ncbi:glycoside hydrolase family 43 protein [Streptacidiphilus carbonis]|uniref:glycoside hydrolase family 43 protein n=1 Tax=Streptacidiphilus carbonis TaxID=105422 RepID=UPI0005A81161|nr:glycoside hydrolase family 43 protein [Streptacidiphilus carbonis]